MEKKEYSVGARFWIRFKWLNRTRATAYLGADGADADAVDHAARVAVVPVLVHELLLRNRVRAQLVAQQVLKSSQDQ